MTKCPTPLRILLPIALMLAPACRQGETPAEPPQGETGAERAGCSAHAPGSRLSPAPHGLLMVVDPHRCGDSPALRIRETFYARLVDVVDLAGALVVRDYPVGADVASGGADYELGQHPITLRERVRILHPFGTRAFQEAFLRLDAGATTLLEKGAGDPPPFTAVPRNAALVLVFDDLLAEETVTAETLRAAVGYPPQVPFQARIAVDRNHGDLLDLDGDGDPEFYPTRVVVDTTVTPLESEASAPPLPINLIGLPPATTVQAANALIRIPTRVHPPSGQFALLRNLIGNPVAFRNNGPNDPASPTLDVVRAARSGGDTAVTGDPWEGFLPDEVLPLVVGIQPVRVTRVAPLHDPVGQPGGLRVDLEFDSGACSMDPSVGDVIELSEIVLEVAEAGVLIPGTTRVENLRVRSVLARGGLVLPGAGSYLAPFEAFHPGTTQPKDVPACFVRFQPPAGTLPDRDVSPDASVVVRFSEPVDPDSVRALDSFVVRRDPSAAASGLERKVVGASLASAIAPELGFVPLTPLDHVQGAAEAYTLEVVSRPGGPATPRGLRDLAGNPLADALGPVGFELDRSAPTLRTNGKVLDFNSRNMDGDPLQLPEIRGGFQYDLTLGVIQPRPVARFAAIADPSQPVVAAMVPYPVPVQTPLSSLGSKLMSAWRYHDVGFELLDEATFDVDVEGLNWSPLGGAAVADHFQEFRMAFAHSRYLPDEFIDTMSLLPLYPASGVGKLFDGNLLDPAGDPLSVVHEKHRGYTIDPADLFTASTGTPMLPWPLNRDLPLEEYRYWTWRDTSVQARGAPGGAGADTRRLMQVTGQQRPTSYPPSMVPSIGLPLLMEFRCYPDAGALGLNGLSVALAVNSSARPSFRAFSTGGYDVSGLPILVDPDNEPMAQGGFNPNSHPPGAKTPPLDNAFYHGQADLVVRVSRVVTKWLDVGSGQTASFAGTLLEPGGAAQPAGTRVLLAFRGASDVGSTGTPPAQEDARNYDAYGDENGLNGSPQGCGCLITPAFLGGDATWKSDSSSIDGARYFQLRATFVSNTETLATPELSGLGVAYLLN